MLRHNNNIHTHSMHEIDQQRAILFHSLLLGNEEGRNNDELKKMLDERKSLAEAKDAKGLTPLQSLIDQFTRQACSLENLKRSALLLIKNGADVAVRDRTSEQQNTLAHHLVLSNKNGVNEAVIKEIQEQNKDFLNEKNGFGWTPLQALMLDFANGKCLLRDFKRTVLLLASLEVDLTLCDSANQTVMHRLVLTNKDGVNNAEIKKLHEKNNELINVINGQGLTPFQSLLQLFSNRGITLKSFKKTALMLAELGANVNVKDPVTAQTMLHLLILSNIDGVNSADIEKILEINSELVHAKNGGGLAPLQLLLDQFANGGLSLKDFKNTAAILAKAGANFALTDSASQVRGGIVYHGSARTFLHHLVLNNQEGAENKGVNDDDIKKFLDTFPDLVDVKSGGYHATPLQDLMTQFEKKQCSLKSFKRTAMILVDKGADPTLKDGKGKKTLLHYLVKTNVAGVNDKEIEMLAKVRPDLLELTDGEEYTPLQLLITKKDANVEAVRKLLDLGASMSVKHKELTLLELACRAGNLSVAKLLVEKGMSLQEHIDADNVHECFAMHKNEELWKWLSDNDVSFRSKDVNDQTLLHKAAMLHNPPLVKWLIKRKVDLNVLDNKGDTPLNLAEAHYDKQSAKHLRHAGAKISNVSKLFNAISQMKKYGESLRAKDAAKAKVAIDLAEQLQMKANELLKMNEGNVDLPAFKRQFEALSHSRDQEMSVYRESWSKILLNIAIALTGVGLIAIAAKLVYSDMTTGRPTFFGQRSETTRETMLADVRSAVVIVGA